MKTICFKDTGNTNVTELFKRNESDTTFRLGMDSANSEVPINTVVSNLEVNENMEAEQSADESKTEVTTISTEVGAKSNDLKPEAHVESATVNNLKVNENMEIEQNISECKSRSPTVDIEMNEKNSEQKLEENISCVSTLDHMRSDTNLPEGTSNGITDTDQGKCKTSNPYSEIHLIQVNNQSLQLLHAYDDNDDDDDEEEEEDEAESTDDDDEEEEEEVIYDGEYRETRQVLTDSEQDSDSDSSSSSSSSSTSLFFSNTSDSDSDNEISQGAVNNKTTKKCTNRPVKTKGELTLEDLPPIEDLKISVPESDCVAVGKVFQIVDKLVVIEALKNTPVLDLDSVLFFEDGQPLGQIFDVFGPVTEPYYCVRFNSDEHIKEKNIVKDQIVYCAPKTEYTSYVFVNQLLKMKGSDASWRHNNEPPVSQLDYSDDEEERKAKKALRKPPVRVDVEDGNVPPRKRPTAYEQRMNERNLQMSMRAANRQRNQWKERTSFAERRGPSADVVWSPAMPQPVFEQPAPVIPTSFTPRPPNPAFGSSPFFGAAPVMQNNMPRQPPPSSSQFFIARHPFITTPPFTPPPHQRNNTFFDPHSCMTPPPPPPQYRY